MAQLPHVATTSTSSANLEAWIKTARPFTLTATISPLLVGTAIAARQGTFNPGLFLAAFFSGLFLQVGANFYNEFYDWRYGLDSDQSLGASKVIFQGSLTARQVLFGGIVSFGIAILFGIILIIFVGPAIILFGAAGMAIAYFYSARPFKLATRGLGDIMVFLAMGVLMTWGAYFVQIHQWSWPAIAASVSVGFIVTAILNMNNTRDYQDDLAVHKQTLPVRFGVDFGKRFHAFLIIGAYVALTFFALIGLLPLLSILVWITFPLAWINVSGVLAGADRTAFARGIKQTAQLHLQFGVVFAATIALATAFNMTR